MKTPPEVSGVRPSSFIAVWFTNYDGASIGKGATPDLALSDMFEAAEVEREDIDLSDVAMYEIVREGRVTAPISYEFKWNSP